MSDQLASHPAESGRTDSLRAGFNSALAFGISIVTIAALLTVMIWLEYRDIHARAERSATDFAAVISSNLEEVMDRANGDVRSFITMVRQEDFDGSVPAERLLSMNALMTARQASFQAIDSYRVFDGGGNVVFTGGALPSGFNVADRAWFKSLKEQGLDTVLSEVVHLRSSQDTSVILAVAIRDAGGRFEGAAVAALNLSLFRQMLADLDIGEGSVVVVRRKDNGHAVVRRPDVPDGANVSTYPVTREVAAGTATGAFEISSPVDSITRIYAFKTLKRHPLFVAVGIARSHYLEPLVLQVELVGPPLVITIAVLFMLFTRENRLKRLLVDEIRQRRESDEKMHQSDGRLRMALAAGRMGVWEWEVETGRAFANDEWLSVFGVEKAVGSRAGFMALVHPEDVERVMRDTDAAIGSQTQFANEYRVVRPDGAVRWVLDVGAAHYDADGRPTRLLGTVQDITERKTYEAEIRQARLAAEEASRAKGNFLAIMSHEIRTPITSILGIADILSAPPLTDEQGGYLRTLKSSTNALLVILNDVLDFSKLDAGKLTIESTPFLLRDVVGSTIDMMRSLASRKGLPIELVISSDVPGAVIGDPTRLKQILFNLTSNAVKFTERGHVRVLMSIRQRGGASAVLLTEIEDSGIGIEQGQIERLFDAFSQADQSTTRRFGGTGLGLAITKKLVGLMGGEMEVESVVGVGSTFRFTLPFDLPEAGTVVSEDRGPAQPALTRASRPLRLLLAEDNRINRMLILSMLRKLGHTVDAVEDGLAAVNRVKASDYDVVIMDMQMPVMDGEEATAAIRALPLPTGGVPVLALTADVMPEHRERYLAAGINGLVPKPIDWPTFAAALDACADGRSPESGR